MKTKLRRLEEENSRKDKQIEQLLDPSRVGISWGDKSGGKEGEFVVWWLLGVMSWNMRGNVNDFWSVHLKSAVQFSSKEDDAMHYRFSTNTFNFWR